MNTVVQGMTSILEWLFSISSMIGLPYYGVAIILFTIIIKVLLYPLTWKQMTSMRRITDLQPKVQELQKKYANNKQMLNQKVMELYSTEKVNPYSGCLPILVQLPILWAFYQALYKMQSSFGLKGTEPSVWFLGFNITEKYGFALDYHLLLPILAGITTYVMTKVSMATNPTKNKSSKSNSNPGTAAAEQTQKMMLMIMPFFMVYIVATLPSGLGIYILTMNVVSMLQTVYINKKLAAEIARKAEETKTKSQSDENVVTEQAKSKAALKVESEKEPNTERDGNKKLVIDKKVIAKKKKKN